MLDSLVDRQDREIAGATETSVIEDALEVAQDRDRTIALSEHTVDVIRPRQVQRSAGDGLTLVTQKGLGFGPEQIGNGTHGLGSP